MVRFTASSQSRARWRTCARDWLAPVLLAGVLAVSAPFPGRASGETPGVRWPATGLPILDCAPAAPAPKDSCLLRLPAGDALGQIRAEQNGANASDFRFDRTPPNADSGVVISTTLVLLDLSPGPGDGRKATWPEERRLIARVLQSMPAGEPVALYGFNEKLEKLSDFSTDHEALARQVEGLDLQGTNTRIATFALKAVDILGTRDKTILRNLMVITDGQEEGDRSLDEVNAAAAAKGVTIASLGMLWRPVGDTANGAGMDFLGQLSEATRGATQSVQLRRPSEAEAELDSFITRFKAAQAASGLILPANTPAKAEIVVTLNTPVPGQPGSYTPTEIRASFLPEADHSAKAAAPPPKPKPPQGLFARLQNERWGGLPLLWWAIGAAVLVVLLLLGAVLLASRRRGPQEASVDDFPEEVAAPTPLPDEGKKAPVQAPAIAYLIRDDDGTRLAIRKTRVTVGRGVECDIVLPDASISRNQCEIRQQPDGRFAVSDSGSLNGTLLEGRELSTATPLAAGDRLTLGEVELRFSPV